MKLRVSTIAGLALTAITSALFAADQTTIRVVSEVKGKADARSAYAVGNRAPLEPSPFVKLPIGSIEPRGWLRGQLELERDGMIGHLKEISRWLNFEKSAWGNTNGAGSLGWEELPYWLKGYGDLGYVLNDTNIIAEAKKWIDSALASQREDGWFGPRELLTSLNGKTDLWPNMVMLNIFQTYYEFTSRNTRNRLGDLRVLEVMTRYFRWEDAQPASLFGEGYWPKLRAGDNVESIYWLYNRTGEEWLLGLAKKIHDNMARWDEGVINWHNVNIAQGFREPTVYSMQSHDAKHRAGANRNYLEVMEQYGQFPGGGFGGDENCRPGYYDPRQGFETCGIVEFMHSFEMLTKITGDPLWSDRCEDIAFNSLPAAMTPDQKGLHYLTCANQIQLDPNNKAPLIQNRGTMFSYSPFEVYRCCQHNVSHGWPFYAEELWLATYDRGLCVSLYSDSTVGAFVGDLHQGPVLISETTDYPFRDQVKFRITADLPVKFPLYLRIPRWCEGASVTINGQPQPVPSKPLSYLVIEREWQNRDTIQLTLPMKVEVQRWAKNGNAASINYGPLSFSLAIKEEWKQYGTRNANWPEWEVLPKSDWNYGLVLDETQPAKSFTVENKTRGISKNPFTADAAPVLIKAQAKKIPHWQADRFNMVGKLQSSPVKSEEKTETVTLIPMGAARLRISTFPVIGSGADAREWTAPAPSALQSSHVFEHDSLDAVNDGIEPKSSSDKSVPRFTWWDHRGTSEWVEWGFPKTRKVSAVQVYWFDDTGKGSCRVPQSWRLLCRVGEQWKPVENADTFGTDVDKYNRVTFAPVECNGLRIEAQLQPKASAGILEWKVE